VTSFPAGSPFWRERFYASQSWNCTKYEKKSRDELQDIIGNRGYWAESNFVLVALNAVVVCVFSYVESWIDCILGWPTTEVRKWQKREQAFVFHICILELQVCVRCTTADVKITVTAERLTFELHLLQQVPCS
jgi:hypothetical protein